MRKPLRLTGLILLLLISATGIYIRYDNLTGHFTHIDDLLVATNLMKKSRTERITEAIHSNDSSAIAKHSGTGLYKTLYNLKDSPFRFSCAYHYFKWREKFNAVTRLSTYAPLQCAMTSWLVTSEDNSGYEEIKFKGRFWSFVFGSLSVIGAGFFIFLFFKEHPHAFWLASLGASIVAFSWENIIYSQQMEPYSIVVFLHWVLLFMLFKLHTAEITWKQIIWAGLLSGFLAWGQYQMLFCGAAFLAALALLNFGKKYFVLKSAMLGIAFALAAFPILGDIKTSGGVNWNVGHGGQFWFSMIFNNELSLGERLIFPVKFFFCNTFLTVRGMIGYVPDEFSLLLNIFTAIFMLLMTVGIYSLYVSWKTDSKRKALGLYFLFLVLVWLVLTVSGKITLSPTRHSMVLLPAFILLSVEGIVYVFKEEIQPAFIGVLLLIQITAFFTFYNKEKTERTDAFSEDEITQLLNQYKPGLVISHTFTDNIPLMKNVNSFHHVEMHGPETEFKEYSSGEKFYRELYDEKYSVVRTLPIPQRILLVSTRSEWKEAFNKGPKLLFGVDMAQYKTIWEKNIRSRKQVEYSSLTENGGNELFLEIIEKE